MAAEVHSVHILLGKLTLVHSDDGYHFERELSPWKPEIKDRFFITHTELAHALSHAYARYNELFTSFLKTPPHDTLAFGQALEKLMDCYSKNITQFNVYKNEKQVFSAKNWNEIGNIWRAHPSGEHTGAIKGWIAIQAGDLRVHPIYNDQSRLALVQSNWTAQVRERDNNGGIMFVFDVGTHEIEWVLESDGFWRIASFTTRVGLAYLIDEKNIPEPCVPYIP